MTADVALRLLLYAVTATASVIVFAVLITWKHLLSKRLAYAMAAWALNSSVLAILLVSKLVDPSASVTWHGPVFTINAAVMAMASVALAISLLRGIDG